MENLPDLAPITRHLRAMYSSRLLIAAVHHLHIFEQLTGPLTINQLQEKFNLKERPAMVLFPALTAMGLLQVDAQERFSISDLGQYVKLSTEPNLAAYIGLEKSDPAVVEMVERLRHDGPVAAPEGMAYVKEGNAPSPMDDPQTARSLTLALAGRAQYLSPVVASKMSRREGHLLDVAGGTGLFTYEWLLQNPASTATIIDRPHVLSVAAEFLEEYSQSGKRGAGTLKNRISFLPGDMLTDELPKADILLAASLFHDWPTATCKQLTKRFSNALYPGGELWVHDAFLNDTLDGPLAATDYSAQLFWVTKGRLYSRKEYHEWMQKAGLKPVQESLATAMDYGLIWAKK